MAGWVYPALLMLWPYPWASRSEERELGRNGVVGREEGGGREEDRVGASMVVVFWLKPRRWKSNNHWSG